MSAKARVLEELKIELSNRDQCILEEKAEKVRLETLNQDLIKRNADTLQELKQNQGTLDHLMAHSRQQSQLVKDMTCQVQETETKLHTIQVQEMYEKRRRELQTRIREEETSQIIQDKDKVLSQLSMELNETRDRLGNIRKDLEQPSGMLNRSMISMASIRSPKNELPRVSQSPKGGDVETSSVHHILASLSKRNANGPKGTNNNSQSPLNRGGNITSMSYTNDSFNSGDVPLEFGNDEAPSQVQQQNDHLNTQYQPYPDDPIDATLSAYLQHNVKHIPLFCRLSSGIYLYGTNRIEMRLQPGGGAGPGGHSGVEILQALAPDGTTWILLEDLLREKLDSAQRLLGS